jgi:two-component SAPR family response regulator
MLSLENKSLFVSLFGPLRLRQGPVFHALNLSGTTRELLTYLLNRVGEATRRDSLVLTFWPNSPQDKGRSALNTALWRINKVLNRVEGLGIKALDDLVVLHAAEDVTVDVAVLTQLYWRARRMMNDAGRIDTNTRRSLSDLLEKCSGSFLEGCNAQWALEDRARIEGLRMRALDLLMEDATRRDAVGDALSWGRLILTIDPLRETVYHDMMCLYVENGERHRALMLYEELRRILAEELQVDLDPATRELRNSIMESRTMRRTKRAPRDTGNTQGEDVRL